MSKTISILAGIAVVIVAVLHFGFLTLEMFFWDHPFGREAFGMTPEVSQSSAALAANQGLYNGILATGLLWSWLTRKSDVVLFFLLSIIVAGIYGAATAKATILFIQAAPALAAAILVWMSRSKQ